MGEDDDFERLISGLSEILSYSDDDLSLGTPQGPARVLLALLDRNPRIVEETLGSQMPEN